MPTTELPPPPSPDEPAEEVVERYREDELRQLAETMALPEVNNNIAAAATLLGGNYMRWYKMAQSNRYLKLIHPAKDPAKFVPTDEEATDRGPLLSAAEQKTVDRIANQDALLKKGDWEALGISPAQAERMISMEKFARLPFPHMIRATHGGMMFCHASLMELLEVTKKRYIDGTLPDELDRDGNPRPRGDVERDWMHCIVAICAEERAIKAQVDKSVFLAIKAKQAAKGGGKGAGKNKPGFGALRVTATESPVQQEGSDESGTG